MDLLQDFLQVVANELVLIIILPRHDESKRPVLQIDGALRSQLAHNRFDVLRDGILVMKAENVDGLKCATTIARRVF